MDSISDLSSSGTACCLATSESVCRASPRGKGEWRVARRWRKSQRPYGSPQSLDGSAVSRGGSLGSEESHLVARRYGFGPVVDVQGGEDGIGLSFDGGRADEQP